MDRVLATAVVTGLLTALAAGCHRTSPPADSGVAPPGGPPVATAPATPAAGVAAPPEQGLAAKQLAGKTFLYNHQLLDGSLDGSPALLAADGKLTGAGEQTSWRVEGGVLLFLDANDAVRTRFDKVYTGPAGLFFLGHRSSDNKYHTLLELPPTR